MPQRDQSQAVEAVARAPRRSVAWAMPAMRAAADVPHHTVWSDLCGDARSTMESLKLMLSSSFAIVLGFMEHDVRDGRWWVRLTPAGRAMLSAHSGEG